VQQLIIHVCCGLQSVSLHTQYIANARLSQPTTQVKHQHGSETATIVAT